MILKINYYGIFKNMGVLRDFLGSERKVKISIVSLCMGGDAQGSEDLVR